MDIERLPYRPCVGAVLFGPQGRFFVGRRVDVGRGGAPAWQLPQGGIDAGEAPEEAVMRELEEEVGTRNAQIMGEHPDWLQYDIPAHLRRSRMGLRYRGQRQRWFALKFLGDDAQIKLDAHSQVEFDAWKWVDLAAVPAMAVAFKRDIYEILARDFAKYVE